MDDGSPAAGEGHFQGYKGGAAGKDRCQDALQSGRFKWKTKPEPFGMEFPEDSYLQEWEEFERDIHEGLWGQIAAAKFRPLEPNDGDEVEFAEFSFLGADVRCERFLKVDQAARKPFATSQLLARTKAKLEEFNSSNPCPPDRAIQYTMAEIYLEEYRKKSGKGKEPQADSEWVPTKHYAQALDRLYGMGQQGWLQVASRYDQVSGTTAAQTGDHDPRSLTHFVKEVSNRWSRWMYLFEDADHRYLSKANEYLASTPGLLRIVPESPIYIALDKKNKLLIYLDPEAVQRTFDETIKAQMESDTEALYALKPPAKQANARTLSQNQNEERNGFKKDQCGVDILGHWHEQGKPHRPMIETSNSHLPSTLKQLLLYYLESTGGTLTRLLDFQFGYLEPELREEYRQVYRDSPKFAKLPATNGPRHEETYCLRANLINMSTDEHWDRYDWKGGLTGLVQLGDFRGPGIVFKQLGIILKGYQSGASMQFRGTIFKHYIANWEGKSRYAFNHTTHETVRRAVQGRQKEIHNRGVGLPPQQEEDDDEDATGGEEGPEKDLKRKRPAEPDDDDHADLYEATPPSSPKGSKKVKAQRSTAATGDQTSQNDANAKQQPKGHTKTEGQPKATATRTSPRQKKRSAVPKR
ncbi:MAG: hypothetical protein LQ338_006174 [Usnochroma carphineum]|nr:MAG: hypothetical protein LQ338_006174 [Usnochroma carphineum]